jgi:hypothetical protein
MTEAEWLTREDRNELLEYLQARAYDRELRLFACACCRRIWKHLKKKASRVVVEISEQFAAGLVTGERLNEAAQKAWDAFGMVQWSAESDLETNPARAVLGLQLDLNVTRAADESSATIAAAAREREYKRRQRKRVGDQPEPWEQYDPIYRAAEVVEQTIQTNLLRDIVPNPFRPVTFDPLWRTTVAVALARQMYDSRDFSVMPILADALQDAGCDSDDILNHCRGNGPHVRGCWVVDLVLGKG